MQNPPTKAQCNDIIKLCADELEARLRDPEQMGEMSEGLIMQIGFFGQSVRDAPEVAKLKREAIRLKEKFGGKKTGKEKAARWKTGAGGSKSSGRQQDPEAS